MTAAAARPGRGRLLAAAAALVTVWLVTPTAVPVYDGIGVPDEPYRYVTPPAGYQQTPPPSSESGTSPGSGGTNVNGFIVETREVSSQSGVFLNPKSMTGPIGTNTFKVTITPVAPQGTTPAGAPDGNVYRIQLFADGSPTAKLTAAAADKTMVYTQRATTLKIASATFEYRAVGGSWTRIPATKGGTDSFQGYFAGAGDYALVAVAATPGHSSHTLVLVLLGLVVVAMAGAVVLIRLSRRPPART